MPSSSPSPSSSPPSSARAPAGRPPTRPADPSGGTPTVRDRPSDRRPDHPARSPATRSSASCRTGRWTTGSPTHLAGTPLTTLALFSVTHTKTGALDTDQTGYQRITGPIGRQLIREAHDRGVAVQLDLYELRAARNQRLLRLGRAPGQDDRRRSSPSSTSSGVDGINVDIERLDLDARPGLRRVRRPAARRRSGRRCPTAQVSVADRRRADGRGDGGCGRSGRRRPDLPDGLRLPLRRLGRRRVGAARPARRRTTPTCRGRSTCTRRSACRSSGRSSACRCTACAGGWPGPRSARRGSATARSGSRRTTRASWPTRPPPPELDPIEIVEFYAVAPTVSPVPGDSRATAGWQAIYVDSPRTLEPKLVLADERGLAGRRVLGDRLRARPRRATRELMKRLRRTASST